MVLLGAGGATVLVISMAMIAYLVGKHTVSVCNSLVPRRIIVEKVHFPHDNAPGYEASVCKWDSSFTSYNGRRAAELLLLYIFLICRVAVHLCMDGWLLVIVCVMEWW